MVTSSTIPAAGADSRIDPTRHLGFLVKDVARLWARHFRQRAAKLSVTIDQCRVLTYLARNEGTTQVRLAELSEMGPMSIVRILDRMEADGWIERRADPADRRVYRLYLTPAADPVLAQITRIAEKVRTEVLAGLPAAERAQLLGLLESIRNNLVALMPDGTAVDQQIERSTTTAGRRRGRPASGKTASAPTARRRKAHP
jgi:DNA-binding MarR family transcriptional regulator